jgi:hypothetical protein
VTADSRLRNVVSYLRGQLLWTARGLSLAPHHTIQRQVFETEIPQNAGNTTDDLRAQNTRLPAISGIAPIDSMVSCV